jgi:hypothetical protein
VIPKAQNLEVILRQKRVAFLIHSLAPRFIVLATIDLDYESSRVTREVDNQSFYWDLTAEMKPA